MVSALRRPHDQIRNEEGLFLRVQIGVSVSEFG